MRRRDCRDVLLGVPVTTRSPLVPPLGEATTADWIRHGIERRLGITLASLDELDEAAANKRCTSFGQLVAIEVPEFEEARMARLRMGHLRYGLYGRNYYDAIGSCIKRLQEYSIGGNIEHLVDIANLAEIEWIWPTIGEGTYWAYDVEYLPPRTINGALGYLQQYQVMGVRNVLPAVAIWCTIEFACPDHPLAHWEAQDCGGHYSLRNSL